MNQFIKFAGVGILNTAIDFAVFNALISILGAGSNLTLGIICKGISFVCAVANSYIWNKYWVFKAIDPPPHLETAERNVIYEKETFLLVSVLGLVLNVAVSSAIVSLGSHLISGIALNPTSQRILLNAGALAGTAAVLIFNFFGYKHIVFKASPSSKLAP